MNALSIKEVAEALQVTPQAIYKRVNENKGNNELSKYVETDSKGHKLISAEGLEHLRQSFNRTPRIEREGVLNNDLIELLRSEIQRRDDEIKRLHGDIEKLKEDHKQQIHVKDEQIERGQRLNENAQKQVENMHLLYAAMTKQQQALIEHNNEPKKKSWLDRFKKEKELDE